MFNKQNLQRGCNYQLKQTQKASTGPELGLVGGIEQTVCKLYQQPTTTENNRDQKTNIIIMVLST